MEARLSELAGISDEDYSKKSDAEKEAYGLEVAALTRGLAMEQGGGGKIGKVIRKARKGQGASRRYMEAMGDVYAKDRKVREAIHRDSGATYIAENYQKGGKFRDGKNHLFADIAQTEGYKQAVGADGEGYKKTIAEGIDQASAASYEFLNAMKKEQFVDFAGNEQGYNSLPEDAKQRLIEVYQTRFGGSYDELRMQQKNGTPSQPTTDSELEGQVTFEDLGHKV